jgi:N-acetylmuramoyl-L-alanine amidase CwlA
MQGNDGQTSYHFAVDDIEAVQCAPLDRNTWHASDGYYGRGNRKTISIEICYSYCGDTESDERAWVENYKGNFEKAQENAAELTAYLLHEYGWGCDLSRVSKHQDYCGKYCPHRTLSNYGWEFFLNLVEEKYKEMYSEDTPMTAEERAKFEALEDKVEKLTAIVDRYERGEVYDNVAIKWAYIDGNLPEWATPTVKKLVSRGYLKGNNENSFALSELMLRILVILDRAGTF